VATPVSAPLILAVDDDVVGRAAVAHILRGAGFRVQEAGGGAEALRLFTAARPDLVLLDVVMPDLDGFEVCRRIKADPAGAPAPVLMISAAAVAAEDQVRGLETADGYLAKPLEPSVLLAHIRALLRVYRAEAEVRAARAAAERAHARLAAIVESSGDAIIGKDLSDLITDWNAGAERLYGYTAAEVRGQSVAVLVPPELAEEQAALMERIQRGEHVEPFETVRLRKDGRRVEVLLQVSPIKDEAGSIIGASAIASDITEQKQLQEKLLQSQKLEAVGRLAGGVAHDFNNLLTVINGYGEVLLTRLKADDPLRGFVEQVTRAGARAASLTRQLLTFSRKQVLAPRLLDLNTVVVETEQMLRRVIGEDVELATRLRSGLDRVLADPVQVEQVILNLAVNARDAMPKGGQLTLETKNVQLAETYTRLHPGVAPGAYVLLAVSDTGQGIPKEHLPHIFEPFFTTKEIGKGTGLGLAIVHGIVKQSGGHLEVYSEPGLGTTFKVYLPRAKEEPRARRSDTNLRGTPRGNETVLLVEDDEAVRVLIHQVLHEAGYSVLEAAHGGEAVSLCRQHKGPIQLLVTDVVMPLMGGRQVAETVRRGHPEMKVLYVSGYTDDAVVRHGILEEEVNFLQKPFTPTALARKVREVLDEDVGQQRLALPNQIP
jgi:PAS domain S-box-containing protein